jgi:hypothetical protein
MRIPLWDYCRGGEVVAERVRLEVQKTPKNTLWRNPKMLILAVLMMQGTESLKSGYPYWYIVGGSHCE